MFICKLYIFVYQLIIWKGGDVLVFLFVCYIYCVFSPFRQFEERELRSQQERAKKRLEFENQKFRLQNQIEFERSRDTIGTHYRSKIVLFFYSKV